MVERYFCLGEGADEIADHYLDHYYGKEFFPHVRRDTATTREDLGAELLRLAEVGCDDVVLFPCSGDLDQVILLAAALDDLAIGRRVVPEINETTSPVSAPDDAADQVQYHVGDVRGALQGRLPQGTSA